MFNNVRKFLTMFSGAFYASQIKWPVPAVEHAAQEYLPKVGKGKGRRSPAPKNAAIQKRAAKKRKGVAINKARHAA